jgi:uncharacterized membrane protein
MRVWSTARSMGWSTRAVIGAIALAVLLVAAVPLALVVGLFLMVFGHVVGGLAVFGASILVAIAGVVIAWLTGLQHVRKLFREHDNMFRQTSELFRQHDEVLREHSYRVVQLNDDDYNVD